MASLKLWYANGPNGQIKLRKSGGLPSGKHMEAISLPVECRFYMDAKKTLFHYEPNYGKLAYFAFMGSWYSFPVFDLDTLTDSPKPRIEFIP